MKKAVTFIIALVVLVSCKKSENKTESEYKTITVKDKFTIELPEFLSETKGLNDDASLQYQNIFKKLFVVVIDEPKIEGLDLDALASVGKGGLESALQESVFSPVKDTLISGMKAKLLTLSGKISGEKIYYELAYLESDRNLYQILTWTTFKKKEKYRKEMKTMLTSLKEIKNIKFK